MLSYATLGVNDLAKSTKFYTQLLSSFGAKKIFDGGRIIFIGESMDSPMLAVCEPYNKEPAQAGNGSMLAFAPGSKEAVDALYAKALELGASCDGEPGQRIPNFFYGAYVRDFDGNKICFNFFG